LSSRCLTALAETPVPEKYFTTAHNIWLGDVGLKANPKLSSAQKPEDLGHAKANSRIRKALHRSWSLGNAESQLKTDCPRVIGDHGIMKKKRRV